MYVHVCVCVFLNVTYLCVCAWRKAFSLDNQLVCSSLGMTLSPTLLCVPQLPAILCEG